ncbi:RNA-binding protein musashi/mRNA cleavage and polyadenylation factor I complex, subunit HRP1 [Handroanthus impetiginosus]|uniref:RNA-binding protein musashi/mRNA cleavage and polyadenylation factor I complex, subunit HRP1 n=1 Tax=Handroanthus impetiginosus TaxID=429701 RepID=A0A2G9GN30_9LAMI|nr:RNA-binding protein musashi/mRNA cleavage and polyadenylation factor I complex, subunit HRP1 [Handroanthus impetiginosus]
MARKRKAPSSKQTQEQKPKVIHEEEEEEETSEEEESEESEEEEEESEEESSSEEEESESEDEEEEESSSSDEEADDEASKRETLRELLEPFGKAQIIDLLKEAVAKDPKLLTKIVQVADSDPTHRKIFIHGLGWDATSEQLVQAFKPFGEIEESKLITDKNTGRAKGYAFVLFKSRAAAKKALKVPQKRIGSRTVSCQLAALGPAAGAPAAEAGNCKIYVGNVAPHVSAEKLKAFFGRFGEIEEGPMGIDPVTNKFKGFAVITYKSVDGYKKALEEPIKVFENCQLHCKKFVDNHNKNNVSAQTSVANMNPAVSDVNYGSVGANAGILGANLNASGLLMAQNQGIGLAGNGMLAAGYNPAGLVASGLSGNYGINSISPNVMGNYGSQAALHGLGAFQNPQLGPSSVGTVATATTATRAPTSVVSSSITFPSYFKR